MLRIDCLLRAARVVARLVLGFFLVGPLTACSRKAPKEDLAKQTTKAPLRIELSAAAITTAGIKTEEARRRSVDEVLSLAGTLSHDENKVARVGPRVGGRVARISVDLGENVRAGQVLALIDSPELGEALAQWRKSRSVYEVRERDFERAKKLLEGKAISQGEFLSREGEFRVSKAEMENADSRMHLFGLSHEDMVTLSHGGEVSSQFPLRSPIAGKVVDRQINPGEVVEAGKPLFTVGDIQNLWLFAQLYEKDLARVRPGQDLEVTTEAFLGEKFLGRIDYVGDQVDPTTRTVRARSVIANPTGKLKPGMFVEARLSVSTGDSVLAVPSGAIAEIDKVPTVFVSAGQNVFEPRAIEPGRIGKTATEVRKGLREGERIVSEGTLTLKAEMQKSELAEE